MARLRAQAATSPALPRQWSTPDGPVGGSGGPEPIRPRSRESPCGGSRLGVFVGLNIAASSRASLHGRDHARGARDPRDLLAGRCPRFDIARHASTCRRPGGSPGFPSAGVASRWSACPSRSGVYLGIEELPLAARRRTRRSATAKGCSSGSRRSSCARSHARGLRGGAAGRRRARRAPTSALLLASDGPRPRPLGAAARAARGGRPRRELPHHPLRVRRQIYSALARVPRVLSALLSLSARQPSHAAPGARRGSPCWGYAVAFATTGWDRRTPSAPCSSTWRSSRRPLLRAADDLLRAAAPPPRAPAAGRSAARSASRSLVALAIRRRDPRRALAADRPPQGRPRPRLVPLGLGWFALVGDTVSCSRPRSVRPPVRERGPERRRSLDRNESRPLSRAMRRAMLGAAVDLVADLFGFVDRSPTPTTPSPRSAPAFERRDSAKLSEAEAWNLGPGDRRFVRARRRESRSAPGRSRSRPRRLPLVGAHIRFPEPAPAPARRRGGCRYQRFGVEPYGAVLLHTGSTRTCRSPAVVTLRERRELRTVLLDFGRPLLRRCRTSRSTSIARFNQKGLVAIRSRTSSGAGLEGAPGLHPLVAASCAPGDRDGRARRRAGPRPDGLRHAARGGRRGARRVRLRGRASTTCLVSRRARRADRGGASEPWTRRACSCSTTTRRSAAHGEGAAGRCSPTRSSARWRPSRAARRRASRARPRARGSSRRMAHAVHPTTRTATTVAPPVVGAAR